MQKIKAFVVKVATAVEHNSVAASAARHALTAAVGVVVVTLAAGQPVTLAVGAAAVAAALRAGELVIVAAVKG